MNIKRRRKVSRPLVRSCGGCDACCTTMGVTELDKPMGEPCPHLADGGGCSVYTDRPKTCRQFRCLWLQDHAGKMFDDRSRPDRSGVVCTAEGKTMRAIEIYPKAAQRPSTQRLLRRAMQAGIQVEIWQANQ